MVKYSAMLIQIFDHTCICRYPHPRKVLFGNDSKFKRYFTSLLNYFSIMAICTSINNLQSNAIVDNLNQVIYNIIVTKYLDIKLYGYKDPWGGTLSSVAWLVRAYYHHTPGFTPVRGLFGRDMLFKLTPILYWCVITAKNQRQVRIDNACKNEGRVRHD